jgi:hypothetical protein
LWISDGVFINDDIRKTGAKLLFNISRKLQRGLNNLDLAFLSQIKHSMNLSRDTLKKIEISFSGSKTALTVLSISAVVANL